MKNWRLNKKELKEKRKQTTNYIYFEKNSRSPKFKTIKIKSNVIVTQTKIPTQKSTVEYRNIVFMG